MPVGDVKCDKSESHVGSDIFRLAHHQTAGGEFERAELFGLGDCVPLRSRTVESGRLEETVQRTIVGASFNAIDK